MKWEKNLKIWHWSATLSLRVTSNKWNKNTRSKSILLHKIKKMLLSIYGIVQNRRLNVWKKSIYSTFNHYKTSFLKLCKFKMILCQILLINSLKINKLFKMRFNKRLIKINFKLKLFNWKKINLNNKFKIW